MGRHLIVLVGQTASGKSDLAVDIAKILGNSKPNTVIFSLDSRQVYKDLNLGSGKVEGEWVGANDLEKFGYECLSKNFKKVFFYGGIPHFLIDFVPPQSRFNLYDFMKEFVRIENLLPRSIKNIILIGGTGLYASAILRKYRFDEIVERGEKYLEIEKRLEKLEIKNLLEIAERLNIKFIKNESEIKNRQRIINKILTHTFSLKTESLIYPDFKKIVVLEKYVESEILEKKIEKRLKSRIKDGMVEEVLDLNLGLKRLQELGLEYRIVGLYLYGWLGERGWENLLFKEIKQYAKRQKTWNQKYVKGEMVEGLSDVVNILGRENFIDK